MHRALEAILGSPRKAWKALLTEAWGLRTFLTDVRRFASRRWRTRKRGALVDPNAFEKSLNQILIDSANALIESKKQVAVAIADEKRLFKQAVQENEICTEWERRAELAEQEGDEALVREARSRAQEHAEATATLKAQWTLQAAKIAELKTALRALNTRIEQAKMDRNRLLATYNLASRSEHAQEIRVAMEERIRILDRLSAIAPRGEEEDAEDGEEEVDDEPEPPLH